MDAGKLVQEAQAELAEFERLYRIASAYCACIESFNEAKEKELAWLREVLRLLPQLHAAIAVFLDDEQSAGSYQEANLEVRFSLFSRLHQYLGERDAYWMEYDLAIDECKSGSLADDLTDIYCELKQGLRMLERGQTQEQVLANWCRGYRLHWGRHLLDAERHLYDLSLKGAI